MSENSPKVSIVLPTYNGARYLKQSIDSCLNQSHKNIELVIVDDGSTDNTTEIIKSYKDSRIKYVRHKKNSGLPNALNTGFAHTTGEYVTWTSDDNYYSENAVEKELLFLRERNYPFVYCDFYRFDAEKPLNLHLVMLPDVLELEKNNDVGPCVLFSRKVLEIIGEFDPDTELAEDYDYWIRVWKAFPMYHLAEPLYFYRDHQHSLTMSRFYEVQAVRLFVLSKNKMSYRFKVESFTYLVARKYPKLPGVKILAKMLAILIFKPKTTAHLLKKGTHLYYKSRKKLKSLKKSSQNLLGQNLE